MAGTAYSDTGGPGHAGGRQLSAVADPTVLNDLAAGNNVGDTWLNTTSLMAFECISNAAGAAVWKVLDLIAITYDWWPTAPALSAMFTAIRPATVVGIIARVDTAGTDAGGVTAQVYKAANGTAISSGSALLQSTINLKGTAATNQQPALTATTANLALAATDSIGVAFTGVMTAANGCITILMLPQ